MHSLGYIFFAISLISLFIRKLRCFSIALFMYIHLFFFFLFLSFRTFSGIHVHLSAYFFLLHLFFLLFHHFYFYFSRWFRFYLFIYLFCSFTYFLSLFSSRSFPFSFFFPEVIQIFSWRYSLFFFSITLVFPCYVRIFFSDIVSFISLSLLIQAYLTVKPFLISVFLFINAFFRRICQTYPYFRLSLFFLLIFLILISLSFFLCLKISFQFPSLFSCVLSLCLFFFSCSYYFL